MSIDNRSVDKSPAYVEPPLNRWDEAPLGKVLSDLGIGIDTIRFLQGKGWVFWKSNENGPTELFIKSAKDTGRDKDPYFIISLDTVKIDIVISESLSLVTTEKNGEKHKIELREEADEVVSDSRLDAIISSEDRLILKDRGMFFGELKEVKNVKGWPISFSDDVVNPVMITSDGSRIDLRKNPNIALTDDTLRVEIIVEKTPGGRVIVRSIDADGTVSSIEFSNKIRAGAISPQEVSSAQQEDLSAQQAEALVSDPANQAEALVTDPAIPEGGEIHKEFVDKSKEITEDVAKADFDVLTGKSPEAYGIEDIRVNARLLKKKEDNEKSDDSVKNLKEETARRMKAYTTDSGDGWFSLDYAKFGADKNGLTHELHIGLGDILLDIDIQEIFVEKNGQRIRAKRGIAPSGRYAGRVCFLDEMGEYLATHTGDRFRILSNDKASTDNYVKKIEEENGARVKSADSFKSTTVTLALAENDVTMKPDFKLEVSDKVDGKEVPLEITSETVDAAARECSISVKNIDEGARRKNLMKILNYIAHEVEVPAYAILTILKRESGISFPGPIGDGGAAVGMGQFHAEAWAEQKRKPKFQELVRKVVNEDPSQVGRGKNLFVDILAVATFLKEGAEKFGFQITQYTKVEYLTEEMIELPDGMSPPIKMSRIAWMRASYKYPGHANACARIMRAGGLNGLRDSKDKNTFLTKGRPDLLADMGSDQKVSGSKRRDSGFKGYSRDVAEAAKAIERTS